MKSGNYLKFLLLLALSFMIMYGVMFLNIAQIDHLYLSTTRFYMTLLMIAPMAIVMVLFMPMMYKNRRLNLVIIVSGTAVFFLSLALLRNQVFINDTQYMKAMIPHHSSAIMVSQQADLKDPRVQELAKRIAESQKKEIAEMKEILRSLEDNNQAVKESLRLIRTAVPGACRGPLLIFSYLC